MKNIMKKAHQIAKTFEGDYSACLALSLKKIWREAKMTNLIDNMSMEELIEMKKKIEAKITEKQNETNEYTFEFEESNDPRTGTPYVAKLFTKDGKMERKFFDLDRQYSKHNVAVFGNYTAKDGEIIEIRTGGSWKNDYRAWHLVQNGELIEVADIDNNKAKAQVKRYLDGQLTAEMLLEK